MAMRPAGIQIVLGLAALAISGCSAESGSEAGGDAGAYGIGGDASAINPPACATGQTACTTGCADLQSDNVNCGTCGVVCSQAEICVGGVCTCAAGLTLCSGLCTDVFSDPRNCGGCAQACGDTQGCLGGTCVCPSGYDACGAQCVVLQSDANNCGGCNVMCAPGQQCVSGACECQAGLENCSGICVDTASDAANCGGCGLACGGGQLCSLGQCATQCAPGLTECGTSCVDLTLNVYNCGACGTVCAAGQSCVAGVCTCPAGLTPCAGSCADLQTDPQNCGACATQCSSGQSCEAGACVGGGTGGATGSGGTGGEVGSGGLGTGGGVVGSGGTGTGGDPGSGGTGTGGDPGSGGTGTGGDPGSGGDSGTGGDPGSGGTSTGGDPGSGGTGTGGDPGSGGTGTGGDPGSGGSGTGGDPGTCDPGTATTNWASNCPTSGEGCTVGTWVAGGPDPDHTYFSLCSESEHFVVYSDEGCSSAAQSAVDHLETVWDLYFGSPMYMREPLCNSSTKYKAAVHVHSDWGLTGGAWDSAHMGMWIGTGGLSDRWGLAHEFTHGVQSVQGGMRCNQSNTCGWVYETHANWSAQQQTDYHQSEVHCSEMMANMPHLYLGSTRDRYCNWQFLEFLKDKHCFSAVNAIWTGTATADPFTAIRNGMGWSLTELNDFFGEWAMHNVTWDYQDPEPQSSAGQNLGSLLRSAYGVTTDTSQTIRRLRTTKVEPLDASYATNRRFSSPYHWAPQRYGYNVVRLYPESGASSVTVTFRGVTSAPSSPDWRWGLVATDSGITQARYSGLQSGSDGALDFCVNSGEELFLVVTATPSAWYDIVWDQAYNTVPRYPYVFELAGAWPEGFRNGTQDDCPSGLTRASNGGGCAPAGTSAYVGPYAMVLSGATASGSARIEDHAIVANGTVSGGTVGALSLIGSSGGFYNNNSFNMTGGTAMTTFYPLGFFESGQGLSGGSLIGDVEYRGGGLSRSSGTCTGFVDSGTCVSPGTDATPAPPYAWR